MLIMMTFYLLVLIMKKCIGANDYSSEKKCTRRHDLSLSAGRQQSWLPTAFRSSNVVNKFKDGCDNFDSEHQNALFISSESLVTMAGSAEVGLRCSSLKFVT